MQLVILAGGKGRRLGLKDIPKPMYRMAGKPVLEHQIALASRYGVEEVFILSGHLSPAIRDYFGDGHQWGLRIWHVVEPAPLGTAGAVKLLEGRLHKRFLVFYGDVVMDFDIAAFEEFDRQADSLASIVVHPNSHPYDSDLVEIDAKGYVRAFLPKPRPQEIQGTEGIQTAQGPYYRNLVNAAVYICSLRLLDYIESGVSSDFGKDLFPKILLRNGNIRAYHTAEYIKDMGTKDRLATVAQDLESGKVARWNRARVRPAVFLDRDGVYQSHYKFLAD